MTITLAFDSFKGSLTSEEVAEAFEDGLLDILPHCTVNKVCIADGGEGTVEALVDTLNGEWNEAMASDPLGRNIKARYGIDRHEHTAILEMATASGLPLLTPEERNPMKTSTYGTGQLIAHAIGEGCRKFLIGIGGSATNDGGTGMLRALGFRFTDKEGNEISLLDVIESQEPSAFDIVTIKDDTKKVKELIPMVLTEREKKVLILRYGLYGNKEYTQREVAEYLGVSRSYISRIEKTAIEKLRSCF